MAAMPPLAKAGNPDVVWLPKASAVLPVPKAFAVLPVPNASVVLPVPKEENVLVGDVKELDPKSTPPKEGNVEIPPVEGGIME
jgi:hypothetical protein